MLTQLHKNKIKKEEKSPKSKHTTHTNIASQRITSQTENRHKKNKGGDVGEDVQGKDDYKVVGTGNTLG